jgi:hypothetical protein
MPDDRTGILPAIVVVGVVAAWIDLGRLQTFQNSDSLLLVVISLQHWTPFYWGQDRFGMLAPLLAMWIRDPLGNLLAQGWMTTTAGLLAPLLAARFLLPDGEDWILSGAVANGLLLIAASPSLRFDWFVTQPYGLALTFGCAGLFIVDAGSLSRRIGGCLLLAAAQWIDEGIVLALFPLALVKLDDEGRMWRLGGVIGAAVFGALLSRTVDAPHTTASLSPVTAWPAAWIGLATTTVHLSSGTGIAVSSAVLAAVLAWRAVAGKDRRSSAAVSRALLIVAIISGLSTGTLEWVRDNGYAPRYVYPSLMLIGVCGGCYIATAMGRFPRYRKMAIAFTVALVMAVTGRPSILMVMRDLHRRFGTMSSEVVHLGVTVIGGDYWAVWPTVFEANLTAARLHSPGIIYGLTSRSAVTNGDWRNKANILLASVPGDPELDGAAERAGVELTLLAAHPTFDLYSVRAK